MSKVRLLDNLMICENFITQEEAEATLKVLYREAEKDPEFWKGISFYESYSSGYPMDGDPYLAEVGLPATWFSDLEKRFKEFTAEMAGVSVEDMSKISFHSQRWLPGAFAPLHSDNSDNEGKLGAFERSRYATFLYLNDNFDGGELVFPQHNLTIKPKAGMIAAFHGGHVNLHRVDVVKKATRYTIGSFWDDRDEEDYPEDLRKAWKAELAEVRAYQKTQQKDWSDVREKGVRISPDGKEYPAEEVE